MKWASRFREPSAKTEQIIAGNTNAILMELEVTNHIMIPSRSEKGAPKSSVRNAIHEAFCWHSESNSILMESKPEVRKTLICSKLRESATESSGATRFSYTFKCAKREVTAGRHEKQNQAKNCWYFVVVCSKF